MRRKYLVALLAAVICVGAGGCRQKKPAVVVAPAPLDAEGVAALRWIDGHAVPLPASDAALTPAEVAPLLAFVGNARILGVSELTEGTHEFPIIVQRILRALAEHASFRGIAVQGPMPEAMELDRYVRSGVGSPQRLLRALGTHWETREMLALVDGLRAYNSGRGTADQVGFYGFELPFAAHALRTATTLPDSVAGTALNRWLVRELRCVSVGESAAWGRGSAAADSGFWNRCRDVTAAAVDSLVALRGRATSRSAGDVAFAEQMARLLQHYVTVGLRKLPRHETVAEHVLWLANSLGADGKLLVWGRDVESGRLTLDANVIQSAVPLASRIGDRYRNAAFTFGEGIIRARPITPGREPGGERDLAARPPNPETYENVLNRARLDAYLVDLRPIATDTSAAWLKGPRAIRLISGVYTAEAPGAFQTFVEFPANFDGVIFQRRVTPAVPLKR